MSHETYTGAAVEHEERPGTQTLKGTVTVSPMPVTLCSVLSG